jgi:hypothetical protein
MSADPAGPLATATASLVDWLRDVAGAPVTVGLPVAPADGASPGDPAPALSVWPLELGPDGQTRGSAGRSPMRLLARYLVAASAGDGEAVGLLDRVLVAATLAGEPTIVMEPPSPQLWLALGVVPRPVLIFEVPVRVERPSATAPLVRHPLRLDGAGVRPLSGVVVGPGEVPLPGVRVEVVGTGAAAYTDTGGQFRFASVPSDMPARLRLQGRGRQLLAEIDAGSTDPVVIHCEIEES